MTAYNEVAGLWKPTNVFALQPLLNRVPRNQGTDAELVAARINHEPDAGDLLAMLGLR